jgi:hypothetical protein
MIPPLTPPIMGRTQTPNYKLQTSKKYLLFLHPTLTLSWQLLLISRIIEKILESLFEKYRILASFCIDDRRSTVSLYHLSDVLTEFS